MVVFKFLEVSVTTGAAARTTELRKDVWLGNGFVRWTGLRQRINMAVFNLEWPVHLEQRK